MRVVPYLCAVPVMAFFGAVLVWIAVTQPERIPWAAGDLAIGICGLVLLRARHRAPLAVALITAAACVLSTTVIGPAFVAYLSLAARRRWRPTVLAALSLWLAVVVYSFEDGMTQQLILAIASVTLSIAGLTVAGLYLAGRRDLGVERSRRQAHERQRQLDLLEQARLGERARIAREMHDVLAHRISLLSLHAAGLAHRTDLGPDEVRAAAAVIHESAHQALVELRATVGGLRDEASAAPPQPSWAQLGDLFAEVRDAGQRVEVSDEITDAVPPQIGRHAYRIVQEGLTNARKHAAGSSVEAHLSGRPGGSLTLRVSNRLSSGRKPPAATGLGLIGLGERVVTVGGTLDHRVEGGRFVLEATLPWEMTV